MNAPRLYRPCVGICLFNDAGKVFVGERIDTPGAWQMPQGGIDEGEDIERAAYRELFEEAGTAQAEIIGIHDKKIRYDLPPHLMGVGHEGRVLWNGQFKGQEQTWVAMRFTGTDADINLSAHDPAEFSQWKWEDLHRVTDLIVPFKRDVYAQVIKAFEKYTIS